MTLALGEEPRRDDARGPVIRVVEQGPIRARLDLSKSVLRVDMPVDLAFDERGEVPETPIEPRLSPSRGDFVSASVLAAKAKAFDDGLYAAVELAAQGGAGRLGAKRGWIGVLARGLAAKDSGPSGNAGTIAWSAARLGRVEVELSSEQTAEVHAFLDAFLKDERRSKPIGFYTWSEELVNIFRQDRVLQTPLDSAAAARAAAAALDSDAGARAGYDAYLSLVGRLTNPLVGADLRSVREGRPPVGEVAILPASRAYETDLVMELYGDEPIPEGFDLADEMIARIRAGTLSIAPGADSGWYDHQTFALEPLVVPERMPEAERLKFSDSYRAQLVELFKGILALTRETHVKQLVFPAAAAALPPELRIAPDLSAEPLPTHYLRRAEGYRFIHEVLREAFGVEGLKTIHRQTASGPVADDLDTELMRIRGLFYGAYAVVSRQIGMEPTAAAAIGSGLGVEADSKAFQAWAAAAGDDPDVGGDHRMMVPVFYDQQRKKTKAWVFLGWASRPLTCAYETRPAIEVSKNGRAVGADAVRVDWEDSHYRVQYPVTAEVYVERILDRDEMRAKCDRHKTRSAILKALR